MGRDFVDNYFKGVFELYALDTWTNAIQRISCKIEYDNGTILNQPRYSSRTKNNYCYYCLCEMEY